MDKLISSGRIVFATGIAAFGILCFVFRDYVAALQPISDAIPGRMLWVHATGLALLAAGIGLMTGVKARWAALLLAAILFAWCLTIHLPALVINPRNGGAWVGMFESLAMAGAALIVAGNRGDIRRTQTQPSERMVTFGRFCFGISLPVFAATHYIYADYVASVIPAWIPARPFWAYFTGLAHLCAGLAILTGIKARLAATLAGAMYGTWAVILHVPRVLDSLGNRAEATSLFVAITLCGAAWLVADSVTKSDAHPRA